MAPKLTAFIAFGAFSGASSFVHFLSVCLLALNGEEETTEAPEVLVTRSDVERS